MPNFYCSQRLNILMIIKNEDYQISLLQHNKLVGIRTTDVGCGI